MKTLENKIEKCIFKQLLEKGNRIYTKYAFRVNAGRTIKCLACEGYSLKMHCYEPISKYMEKRK